MAGGIIEEDNLLNKRDVRWWRPPAQPSNDQIATTQYNEGNDQIATFPSRLQESQVVTAPVSPLL